MLRGEESALHTKGTKALTGKKKKKQQNCIFSLKKRHYKVIIRYYKLFCKYPLKIRGFQLKLQSKLHLKN